MPRLSQPLPELASALLVRRGDRRCQGQAQEALPLQRGHDAAGEARQPARTRALPQSRYHALRLAARCSPRSATTRLLGALIPGACWSWLNPSTDVSIAQPDSPPSTLWISWTAARCAGFPPKRCALSCGRADGHPCGLPTARPQAGGCPPTPQGLINRFILPKKPGQPLSFRLIPQLQLTLWARAHVARAWRSRSTGNATVGRAPEIPASPRRGPCGARRVRVKRTASRVLICGGERLMRFLRRTGAFCLLMIKTILRNVWTRDPPCEYCRWCSPGCSLEDKASNTVATVAFLEPAPDSGAATPD